MKMQIDPKFNERYNQLVHQAIDDLTRDVQLEIKLIRVIPYRKPYPWKKDHPESVRVLLRVACLTKDGQEIWAYDEPVTLFGIGSSLRIAGGITYPINIEDLLIRQQGVS